MWNVYAASVMISNDWFADEHPQRPMTLDVRGLLEFLKGLEPVELPAEEVTAQMKRHLATQAHG